MSAAPHEVAAHFPRGIGDHAGRRDDFQAFLRHRRSRAERNDGCGENCEKAILDVMHPVAPSTCGPVRTHCTPSWSI
jgi:hypothetical protein